MSIISSFEKLLTFGGTSMRMEAAVQGREEGAREGKGLVNTRRLLLTLVSIQPLFGWTGSTCNRETTTLEWKTLSS